MHNESLLCISDDQLLVDLKAAASHERAATAHLIALLAEMDRRRLYLAQGYSSLFVYCTQCLRLSEHASYGRIEAARASSRFPTILGLLADGSVTLTTVCLLASHLTADNYSEVLEAARYKSKREVENQIAMLTPRPPVPSVVRKLPALKPTCLVAGAPSANAVTTPVSIGAATKLTPMPYQRGTTLVIAPLAPDRYKFQVTITRETHDKLRKIQDLLRHAVPNGDPAVILDRALTCLLQDLEKRRGVQAARPRGEPPCNARGRHVPAAVRREVWARDEGHCAFVGVDGRCAERGFLEFHHVIPFADGGPTTVDNLQLRCRAHNAYEAREYFGPALFRERPIVYELGPALLCHIRSWTDRSASIRRK